MVHKKYRVVANSCGTKMEADVLALDKFDAEDVFRAYHRCYGEKVADLVDIISVEEVQEEEVQ